jgi:plastocyanin
MTRHFEELTRSVASLVGLCTIAAAGLTLSCFSERGTGVSESSCDGTSVPCVVEIRNLRFQPALLRVPAGATVTWVNRDQDLHTSTSDNGVWDSDIIAPDASFVRTFTTAGQFPYHCVPHPTMMASIVVE